MKLYEKKVIIRLIDLTAYFPNVTCGYKQYLNRKKLGILEFDSWYPLAYNTQLDYH